MKWIDRQGKAWRVRFMRNGKRLIRSFATKAEAEAQLRIWKNEPLGLLSSGQTAEAAVCYEKLNGLSLLDAVNYYLEHGAIGQNAPVIKDAVERYLTSLREANRSERHIKSFGYTLAGFVSKFGAMRPCEVSLGMLREWVEELRRDASLASPITKLHRITAVRSFFGWVKKQGWIKDVPVIDDSVIPRAEAAEPEFYTAAQTRDFFKMLEEKYPRAIPHFAVRAFFGVRTAEANRLTWDDVDLDAKILRVRATKAKTKTARTLDTDLVPETGFVWLRAYFDRGRATFRIPHGLGTRIYADFGCAVDNGFRKSFATMFTSLTKNQQMTMMATGHTSLTTLRRHYEATKQPKEEAQAYFAVLPTKRAA